MSYDVSATGVSLRVVASETFPEGFSVTAFADDADPFDLPEIEIVQSAMNLNGDLVTWSAPQPITMPVNVIAGTEDDDNLAILFNANRAARGRRPARDTITIVGTYPDGSTITFGPAKMRAGRPGKSPTSDGKMKSMSYGFVGQDITPGRA